MQLLREVDVAGHCCPVHPPQHFVLIRLEVLCRQVGQGGRAAAEHDRGRGSCRVSGMWHLMLRTAPTLHRLGGGHGAGDRQAGVGQGAGASGRAWPGMWPGTHAHLDGCGCVAQQRPLCLLSDAQLDEGDLPVWVSGLVAAVPSCEQMARGPPAEVQYCAVLCSTVQTLACSVRPGRLPCAAPPHAPPRATPPRSLPG